MDGKELMPRATVDVQDVDVDEGPWKYVLIGKKKNGEESVATHYILLIRLLSSSNSADGVYERAGVAISLASHLSSKFHIHRLSML